MMRFGGFSLSAERGNSYDRLYRAHRRRRGDDGRNIYPPRAAEKLVRSLSRAPGLNRVVSRGDGALFSAAVSHFSDGG